MAGFSELSKKRLQWTYFRPLLWGGFNPLREEGQRTQKVEFGDGSGFRDISTRDRQTDSGSERCARQSRCRAIIG